MKKGTNPKTRGTDPFAVDLGNAAETLSGGAPFPAAAGVNPVNVDEAVLGSMGEGLYTTDDDGLLLTMNPAAERILGWSADELRGRKIHDIIHWKRRSGEPLPAEQCPIYRVFSEQRPAVDLDDVFIRKDGTFLDVRYTASPLTDPTNVVGLVVVFRDVSERRESERDREFLFRIADRIRTALNPNDLIRDVSRMLGEYFRVHRCLVNEIDLAADTETVHSDYFRDGGSVAGKHPISAYSPVTSEVMRSGKPVVNRDSRTDPRTAEFYDKTYGPSRERSYVAVPMLRGGQWVASLWCSDDEPRDWTTREIVLLEDIAERLWAAVERLRSGEALRKSEARLRALVSSSSDVIFRMSADWSTMLEIDGRVIEPEGTAGENWLRDNLPPDERERISSVVEKAIAEGSAFEADHRVVRNSGTTAWMHTRAVPITDESGRISEWFGTSSDITDSKASETALRESEEKFRTVFESIDEGFVIVEMIYGEDGKAVDYRFLEANDAFTRLTGLPPDSIGKTARQVIPGLEEFWFETYARVASTGEPVRFEHGSEAMGRWFDVYAVRASEEAGGRVAIVFSDISGRRLTEERLRESEERFSKAFKASPLVLTITSLKTGKLLEVNETFTRVTGYSRAETIGKTTLELGLWDNADDREAEMDLVRSAGQLDNAEYIFRLRDGRAIIGLLSAERVDIGGEPCALTVIQDITDRKKAAESLKASEERFRLATEAVQAVIYDWNIVDDTIERSAELERLIGFRHGDAETLSNSWWRKRLHPDDFERSIRLVENAIGSGGMRYEDEYRIRHRDGRYIWVSDTGLFIRDDSGRAVRCVGSVTDITARKQAEAALRESEQRFRYTSDAAPVLIWMADSSKQCTWFNKYWLDFTGRAMEQELGFGWAENVHPDDRDRCLSLYDEGSDLRREFSVEYRLRRADGEYRWVLANGIPRVSGANEFLGYIGSAVDIHDRRAAEAALRESEQRSHLAQSAGNVGVWDWDVKAGQTYWSDTMWRFYGEVPRSVNPDDAFWSRHLHPADHDRVKAQLYATVASSAEQYRDEFRIISSEGHVLWMESIANVVRDRNGEAVRMYGVNLDITERKLSEEKLKRSERQLRLVTDSLPALISYVDADEAYQFVNQTYSEWFGLDPADVVGKPVREVVGEKAYPALKPLIDTALRGETVSLQTEIDYPKIGSRFIHLNYVPDVSSEGTVRGFYSLISDFTEIRDSQEMLRSSEQRIALLMESVTDYAIISTNIDGLVESWNTGAEAIFGYPAEEIIGRSADILFTPEDREHGVPDEEMRNARQNGRAIDERWHMRKDGTRFFASGVMMPLIVGKRLSGYAKIASDLTEKKRRAEELQSAHDELELRVQQRTAELAETNELLLREIDQRKLSEKQRVNLLHRIVSAQEAERKRIARDIHDHLGQRLTALRLKLAALRDVSTHDEEIKGRVERLQEIATLLDSEVSFLASELRPSVLDDLGLEDALRAYAGDWSTHFDIRLDFHSNGLIGKRFGREKETQLYRIAQEALNNVAKHAHATEVTMMMEQTADFLVLIVEDNGSGFDPQKTTERANKGLGLLGMKERAALIGAELEIESSPGEGSTVFLRLPNRRRGNTNGR